MSSTQKYFIYILTFSKPGLRVLIRGIEGCLGKAIARVAENGYKEQVKINFSLIYFNLSQAYLAMNRYDLAMENLDMASQYQKVGIIGIT
jgi:hypothetical protein